MVGGDGWGADYDGKPALIDQAAGRGTGRLLQQQGRWMEGRYMFWIAHHDVAVLVIQIIFVLSPPTADTAAGLLHPFGRK